MDPRPPNTAAAKPFTVIATSELYVIGLLGASRAPPSAQSSARADERDDGERAGAEADELGGASRVRARDERLPDDRPAQEERQRDGERSATPAMRTYCGWTRTPPTSQAVSEIR